MPGVELDLTEYCYQWDYVEYYSCEIYGFLLFEFLNQTHCIGKFINSANNQIVEQFYVLNTYH